MTNFPQDDENSMHCGSGEANLSMYYSCELVQGELWKKVVSQYKNKVTLERTPLVSGSLIGEVLQDGLLVERFVETDEKIYPLEQRAAIQYDRCKINRTTGELEIYCDLEDFDLRLTYEFDTETPNNQYFIQGTSGFDTMGHLLTCQKCGKKILVEVVLMGTNHNTAIQATCLDCLKLSEEFRSLHPKVADQIDHWRA